ncbi:hypothetical protein EVAR_10399_1 [Eumeta japonica]|uniref:Uncharacterized protein n=1 Tax=Eumeta variegata TaxID=151549 RepID=A0A4C1UCK2_EUMVA|nr:hypothetical protein EVAR_10399_1 [Eumeta japonica]
MQQVTYAARAGARFMNFARPCTRHAASVQPSLSAAYRSCDVKKGKDFFQFPSSSQAAEQTRHSSTLLAGARAAAARRVCTANIEFSCFSSRPRAARAANKCIIWHGRTSADGDLASWGVCSNTWKKANVKCHSPNGSGNSDESSTNIANREIGFAPSARQAPNRCRPARGAGTPANALD